MGDVLVMKSVECESHGLLTSPWLVKEAREASVRALE